MIMDKEPLGLDPLKSEVSEREIVILLNKLIFRLYFYKYNKLKNTTEYKDRIKVEALGKGYTQSNGENVLLSKKLKRCISFFSTNVDKSNLTFLLEILLDQFLQNLISYLHH